MYKYAERQVIVEAMTKIANANGYQLTPQVAEVIAYQHQHSPVLIMKTAGELDISGLIPLREYMTMSPNERVDQWPEHFLPGYSEQNDPRIDNSHVRSGSFLGGLMGAAVPGIPAGVLGTGMGVSLGAMTGINPALLGGLGLGAGIIGGGIYGALNSPRKRYQDERAARAIEHDKMIGEYLGNHPDISPDEQSYLNEHFWKLMRSSYDRDWYSNYMNAAQGGYA